MQGIVAELRVRSGELRLSRCQGLLATSIWATSSIQTALLYDKQRQVLLAVYFNPTATDRLLKGNAREALDEKVHRTATATCWTRSAASRNGT